jgi:uncharacterized membrane protein
VSATEISAFSGPLPPPEILLRYGDVYNGCARDIVEMARTQAQHRQTLEQTKLKGDLSAEKRGQIYAAGIAIVAILCGTYLAATGKPTTGLVTILGTVGSLVGVFLFGRLSQSRERREKLRALEEAASQKRIARYGDGPKDEGG